MLGRKIWVRHRDRSASSSGDSVGVNVASPLKRDGVVLKDLGARECRWDGLEDLIACKQLRHT